MDQVITKKISVNGAELNYVERGFGEPVIFVHGSLGDYRTWLPQVEQFSQKFRAISYSRRYHFPNPWQGNATDYTPGLHAEDLIALIEGLGIKPAYVVGNSFGAYTTLVATIRRPDLMRKVVIGEPPVLTWLKEVPGGQEIWDNFMQNAWFPARESFQAGNMELGVRKFVEGVSLGDSFDAIPEAAKDRMLDNAGSLMAETLAPDYFTEITPRQLEQIPVPSLWLKGENSPRMFHLVLDRLARFVHNGRVVTIPHTSHSIAAGNPQAYNEVVEAFLEAN